jgi:proton-dependent oligopeptide transporter, POT family
VRGWLGFAGQPPGLATLFFAELWERFSYYGMRALLVLFVVAPVAAGGLGLATEQAALIYGNYTMAVYVLAIPGGFIADAFLGAKRAVLFGGVTIALGHFSMAIPTIETFYLGLTLIALGTGLFKPAISALVGGLYGAGDIRRDSGFSIFYMGINVGGLLAPIVTGFLAQSDTFKGWLAANGFDPAQSWHWGFAAAGVGMTLGLAILARRFRALDTELQSDAAKLLVVKSPGLVLGAITAGTLCLMVLVVLSDREGLTWIRYGFVVVPSLLAIWFGLSGRMDVRRLGAIAVLFVASMIFWAIFEQAGVTIALFADQLTRADVLGLSFPSAWFQSLNSLFVILLTPFFAWYWMRGELFQPSSPAKFALGLAFLSASFLLMVPAAMLTIEGRVSPLWLVGLFFLQTVGELLLSPIGLSTMTKLAPARTVSLVLGVWFLAAALGNKLAGVLGTGFTATDASGLASFFFSQGVWVAVAALVLAALTPWVKRLMSGVS